VILFPKRGFGEFAGNKIIDGLDGGCNLRPPGRIKTVFYVFYSPVAWERSRDTGRRLGSGRPSFEEKDWPIKGNQGICGSLSPLTKTGRPE
jgi:hypothetical protein